MNQNESSAGKSLEITLYSSENYVALDITLEKSKDLIDITFSFFYLLMEQDYSVIFIYTNIK